MLSFSGYTIGLVCIISSYFCLHESCGPSFNRSSICMRHSRHTQLPIKCLGPLLFFFLFLSLGLSFFRVFCIIAVSFCMEGTLYVSLPDDVFYLVISGCIIRDKDGKR